MIELFANCGDPDQGPHSGSALFANYPFRGFQTTMGSQNFKPFFFFYCCTSLAFCFVFIYKESNVDDLLCFYVPFNSV